MAEWAILRMAESDVDATWDRRIRELLCECFPHSASVFTQNRCWHDVKPAWSLWVEDNGRPVAHLCVIDRRIQLGETFLRAAGVGTVCVAESYRGQGLARRLLERAMDQARQELFDIGLLFCRERVKDLYVKLGWRELNRQSVVLESVTPTYPAAQNSSEKRFILYYPLSTKDLPTGSLNLCGRNW